MASNSLGDLWFQLGVKDNTSKEIQKIIDKLKSGDDAANAMLRTIQGFGSDKKSFKEQAEKAKEFADVLNEINRRISKLRKNGKNDKAKELQETVKNALTYLDMLQRINIERRKISELRTLNPNVDTSKLKEAEKMLENVNNQLFKLQDKEKGRGGGGVDSANVLQDYAKVLRMTFRDVKEITDNFRKENPLSAFSGGTAVAEAGISRVSEKLAKLRDLMSEGAAKGFNTSMLAGSITELDKVLTRLQAAKDNKSILTDASQMKNLISDMTLEMTKAATATQAYGREKGKVIAQEKELAGEYNRQKRQQEIAKSEQAAELKAMSDYAKRYMELQEAKRKADEKATADAKKQSERRAAQVEKDTRKMSELYSILGVAKDKAEKVGVNGLALNVDTSKLEAKLKVAEDLMNRISNENPKLLGMGGRASSADYATEVRNVKRALDEATASQKELNRAQERANKTAKREEEKRNAQAIRDAAKAAREDAQAEKQRQREIEVSKRRIQSMEKALSNLQEKRYTSKMLGLDTSEADAKIGHLKNQLADLRDILHGLQTNGTASIGQLGNIGNGREVQAANNLAASYDKANKETQKGIELEQKRQQEIAKTAAKVRSDLVKGLEQANSHAGKLNSTIQDIKSLFLQGGLVFGAQQFAMSIITTGGEMEKQHIALQSILGDIQNANTLFGQVKELALNSPFTFSELNRDVKQLAAYGVEYDQLYDTTKRLADISSGLGVSFDRIALAFGQVQARGWLDGKELRQIAYAGIPLLEKLSEYYSKKEGKKVTTSEIKTRISKRDVSFSDVKNIFWEMTDAGGQFYNMQQTLSETLLGRYNKLKDAWEIMLAEFASGNSLVGSFFKTALDGATALVQAMHTLALPVGTLFAGFAMKKMLGSNTGSSFLKNKGSIANELQKKVMNGEQLTQIERNLLATKNQITGADLRQLAVSKQLTQSDLNRLRLSGHISAKQYEIYRALLQQQAATANVTSRWAVMKRYLSINGLGGTFKNMWSNFATSGMAAIKLVGSGLAGLGKSMWSFIGGLPGLVMTGVTFGITYAISKYQEISQQMKQTQDELQDRIKQISEFTKENNAKITIAGGDTKEIENTIDEYEKKLKELAPYCHLDIVTTAESKKDRKETLKYLDEEIEKLKEAQELAAQKLSQRSTYNFLRLNIGDANDALKDLQDARNSGKDTTNEERYYNKFIDTIKAKITSSFGDIAKDEKMRMAAMQAMSNIFSALEIPEDKANMLRVSVLESFGIGGKDSWLQGEVRDKMFELISQTSSLMAAKIKANVPLTKAEQDKVKELMNDARNGLIKKYPELEKTLQTMLANSEFKAVIDLVINGDQKFNSLQSVLVGRIPKFSSFQKMESDLYTKLAESWGEKDSWYEARNAAKNDIDHLKNEYESAKSSHAKDVNVKKYEYEQTKKAAKDLLNYYYDGDLKKSNKIPKTKNEKDKELENLRTRIDLYKKLYQEIKKTEELYGKSGALDKLRSDGEFKAIFDNKKGYPIRDYRDYKGSIHALLGTLSMSTQDRRNYRDEQIAGIYTENRKDDEEAIKDANSALSKRLYILREQYETYKKIYELTGNSKGSMKIAFGGSVSNDSMLKYLKAEIENYLPVANRRSKTNLSIDDVMSMDENNLNEKFGKGSEHISVLISKLKAEQNKIQKETIDLLAETIEKNATIDQQIADENRRYERQVELIKEIKDPQMRQRAQEGAKKTHEENSAKLEFEKFKQTTDWVTIFDDLDRVSSNTINTMLGHIDTFSKKTGLSVEVVKQLRDALDKLKSESIERNPMDAIFKSTSRGNAIKSYLNSFGDDYKGNYILTGPQAKKMGLQANKTYTKAELENEAQGDYDDFGKGISALAQKFKALQDCLNPVIELFNALGLEDNPLVDAMNIGSNALGAASQTASGLQSLGLGNLGQYGAAAAAALSVVSGLFALHDKALQKEIEASEARQKEMGNMTKNIKTLIEDTLGGIYTYSNQDTAQLDNIVKDYEDTAAFNERIKDAQQEMAIAMQRYTGTTDASIFKKKSKYSEDTYKAAKEAQEKPDSAYHAEFASLMAQRDELQNQRDAEAKKKKKDDTKIADYDQQIKEMEQSIKTFAQDFLKEIYSIDFKSWASELTDAVVSAWENGEDAVDAYKDKVKDMIKDVAKSIISQKIVETYMNAPLKALTETLKEKGKLDKDDLLSLADQLYSSAEGATTTTIDLLNYLKEKGLDLSDTSGSSTTNSAKSITEETADILASYVNAIRLDCSMTREQVKIIASAVALLPDMSVIAKSQLAALNQLVTLAQYRNDTLDDMYSWMRSVTNGTKKLSVA